MNRYTVLRTLAKVKRAFVEKTMPRWLVFIADVIIIIGAVYLAFLFRFNFQIPENYKSLLLFSEIRITSYNVCYTKLLRSNSGKTREILELFQLSHHLHAGLPVIVLTGQAESPLGELADAVLSTGNPSEVCPLGLTPTTSTTAMTVITSYSIHYTKLYEFLPWSRS